MKHIFSIILFLMISLSTYAQTAYCSAYRNEIILHKTYLTISYNPSFRIPNYVGYVMFPHFSEPNYPRPTKFYAESDLPKKCRAYSSEYTGTNFDRGHMAPAADYRFDSIAINETFTMANIAPQTAEMNRQWWKAAEEHERDLSKICDTLYVISGIIPTAYGQYEYKRMPKTQILIPSKFYKTIIGIKGGDVIISIGYVYWNNSSKQPLSKVKHPIDYIEKIIKKDLYRGFWFNELHESTVLDQYIKH